MKRITTIAEMRRDVAQRRAAGRRVALVPTMGALHDAHLALVRLAASQADDVVVSIFVNPTQFDRSDDLAAYPRDLDGDERALATLGAAQPAVVFAPELEEMYPRPPVTTVRVAELTSRLCGASRPGHFDGVATVVTKLLAIVAPDIAVFGRKDRQQLAVVERLVEDLNLPVEIVAAPTVREADGVATSSRNRRLDTEGRRRARGLSGALAVGVDMLRALAPDQMLRVADLEAALRREMADAGLTIDYAEVVEPGTMQPPLGSAVRPSDRLVLAVAAYVSDVRLIDNVEFGDAGDEKRLLAAVDADGE